MKTLLITLFSLVLLSIIALFTLNFYGVISLPFNPTYAQNISDSVVPLNDTQISALNISETHKSVLRSGRIYKTAPHDIIYKAMGEPNFVTAHVEDDTLIEIWGYHLDSTGRPTLLELIDGKLSDAYRSSYADVQARYGKVAFKR